MSASLSGPSPHALILAAGVGRRLYGAQGPGPKALLRFGGRSLLARHVAALRGAGVEDIGVVTGFEAEQIEAATREHALPGARRGHG